MSEQFRDWMHQHRVFDRLFGLFYMYWMADMLVWVKELENPAQAEWVVAAVLAGGAAYFKVYIDGSAER